MLAGGTIGISCDLSPSEHLPGASSGPRGARGGRSYYSVPSTTEGVHPGEGRCGKVTQVLRGVTRAQALSHAQPQSRVKESTGQR